ncbi:PREDICTED: uncharacterized protein LOC108548307 isoform X2 [Eufriesea mexicana]|uniref:uncharacterized protein LOC108548307 isoform X2 n=1 Tax=Eufriesea mexicana TaxID=516756 RepID=UPI00083BF3A3|nr:PREDICTED: uncharacterized protein LOC108548307 isoform X2 [Eufriesea mexicana]
MLLCGVLCTALSVSFGAIVQIVIFLLQNSNILKVQASLPPGAEDEIVLIEHLPGRRVHLQDFFWSDAKDAPPWVDSNQGLTIYETRTVHHTVTLYSPAEEKDDKSLFPDHTDSNEPKCITCIEPTPRLDDDEDQNIGILIGEDPGPRYWLLTVLRAGEAIPPKIELKLARLYKTAFSRQQQRHLGLLQTESRFRRVTRGHAVIENKPKIAGQEEIFENSAISSAKLRIQTNSESQISTMPNRIKLVDVPSLKNNLFSTPNVNENYSKPIQVDNFHLKKLSLVKEKVLSNTNLSTTTTSVDFNDSTKDYTSQQSLQNDVSFNLSSMIHNLQNLTDNHQASENQILNNIDRGNTSASKRSELRLISHSGEETVQVRMQNTSVTEGGATKLIYSVHLGGKPVPAETAARDMALLSPQEVALELGAPVLIQSEPYLKETRPLALSRKRDAWLLIGAASAGFILLALVVLGLILAAKRKRAHSAVAAPPSHHTLKKNREYIQATAGLDNNACSTSEMEIKTDGTSQRQTPGSLSRTPVSLETPDSLEAGIHEVSSDDEEQKSKARESSPWEHPSMKPRLIHGKMSRTNAIDTPRTSDSTDVIVDHLETLDSLENNYTRQEEATASPHSYLSMPSCKPFPSMKSVEPLSRVLEPVMVKHLDIDSPELIRREDDHLGVYRGDDINDKFFARTSSAIKDPGVVGPIVWNLRRQNLSAEGKARRRLHELLEDSFSLFGSRDPKSEVQLCATRPTSAARTPDILTVFSETKGRSTHASPVSSPSTVMKSRPRTSFPIKSNEGNVAENSVPTRSRNSWGSRPLSAGPFHRPNLPDIDTRRILTDCQLPPEDPAVPLIVSIKKELEKFSPQ